MTAIELMCTAILALGVGGNEKNGNFACSLLPEIYQAAHENDIDPSLIVSVIHYESRFRPKVVSSANACGLMQVVPKWTGSKKTGVPKLSCSQLKNPSTNIKYGTFTLRYWIKKYGRGSLKVGLCGYNAGFRCKGKSPNLTGMKYAKTVKRLSRRIKRYIALNSSK